MLHTQHYTLCLCIIQVSLRIDEIFAKESDPFTTNEGMLDVINTIRFRHFDAAIDAALAAAGDKVHDILHYILYYTIYTK
jgi:hypothetical protein